MTADAGYHSAANLKALADTSVEASSPDNGDRKRAERGADQASHTATPDPRWNKAKTPGTVPRFPPQDFQLAEDRTHCTCPAGKRLYGKGSHCTCKGFAAIKFRGAEKDCLPCAQRHECLRTPEKTKTRQVACFQGNRLGQTRCTDRMKTRIDSETGRHMITRRFATVEPVFGNLRGHKHLCRFSLRGQQKVDGQWQLYGLRHNIEKLAHHGYGR